MTTGRSSSQSKEDHMDIVEDEDDGGMQVLETLRQLQQKVDHIRGLLEKAMRLDRGADTTDPAEAARLSASLAFALHCLYYVYMKVSDVSFEGHAIMSELGAVRQHMKRLKELDGKKVALGEVQSSGRSRGGEGPGGAAGSGAQDGVAASGKKKQQQREERGKSAASKGKEPQGRKQQKTTGKKRKRSLSGKGAGGQGGSSPKRAKRSPHRPTR